MRIVPLKRCVAALGLVAIAATSVSAQEARVGPRWLGWVGCWTASVPGASAFASPAENGTFVCITPAVQASDAIEVTTVAEGKIVSTQRIDASGTERPLEAKGCSGVQRATWSSDERRIYLRSASTCDGLKSTSSGILSMTSTGEWLDVRGVSSYGSENVRVARYRDAGIPASVPAEVANALRERSAGVEVARMRAGARIGASAVIEASRAADSTVVAAWLLEREQRFELDAKTLVQLADAGVPGAVIDAMVAVSNPAVFHVARASAPVDSLPLERVTSGRRVTATMMPYDPWTWGTYGLSSYRYGYPYGYGYGYGYGGYGYGYNNGYYGGYAPPIIIINGRDQGGGAAGQMVKGRGYTQPGGSSTGTTARERPSQTSEPSYRPSSSSGSSSSGSSSSGSSSGGSSSGSSEGRTAKPRP
jgi:hypothetical protein